MPNNCCDTICKHGFCNHNQCGIKNIICIECIIFGHDDIEFFISEITEYRNKIMTYKRAIYEYGKMLRTKSIYGNKNLKYNYFNNDDSTLYRITIIYIFISGYNNYQYIYT